MTLFLLKDFTTIIISQNCSSDHINNDFSTHCKILYSIEKSEAGGWTSVLGKCFSREPEERTSLKIQETISPEVRVTSTFEGSEGDRLTDPD